MGMFTPRPGNEPKGTCNVTVLVFFSPCVNCAFSRPCPFAIKAENKQVRTSKKVLKRYGLTVSVTMKFSEGGLEGIIIARVLEVEPLLGAAVKRACSELILCTRV